MAHELSFTTDAQGEKRAELAYNLDNGVPWHSLGEPIKGYLSAPEAVRRVLPWTVRTEPVYTSDGKLVTQSRAVVREDTGAVIGAVGPRHTLLQNHELGDILGGIFGPASAVVDVIGALRGGARTFVLARLPQGFEVREGDRVARYLLAYNPHDGDGGSVVIRWTTVRVACANLLSIALRERGEVIRVRHTPGVKAGIEEAARVLAKGEAYWRDLRAYFAALSERQLSAREFESFLASLVPAKTLGDGTEETTAQAKKTRDRLRQLFEGDGLIGADLDGGKNAWRAFQAVTQFTDRERAVRGGTNRIAGSLFGEGAGAALRQRASDLLRQLV
jgi:phage/plasmid-like protein (TIGR03299 family)